MTFALVADKKISWEISSVVDAELIAISMSAVAFIDVASSASATA